MQCASVHALDVHACVFVHVFVRVLRSHACILVHVRMCT